MAHDHGAAAHSYDHTAEANGKMLGWALALTSVYLVAEMIDRTEGRSLMPKATAGTTMLSTS